MKKNRVFQTIVPNIGFEYRQFSNISTIFGYLLAMGLEEATQLTQFIRVLYHFYEPIRDSHIEDYVKQIEENQVDLGIENLREYFEGVFSWKQQERVLSEMIFTKLVDLYVYYVKIIASHVLAKRQFNIDHRDVLRNFLNVKKCYRDIFKVPLFHSIEDEQLAEQLISLRNILVHNVNFIPDSYLPKFHNWDQLGCITQREEEILEITLNFDSLERLGLFLVKSAADVDNRLAENFEIKQYYFDAKDIPQDVQINLEFLDDDFFEDD
jgi:hypothetical protein